jgi:tetratricopeptide (TPR) repeat protein
MDKHDLAEQMFYLAQQINPDCALCYYNIGNSLFARGQYKKAVRCWLRTAELEPGHPQINYRIAQAYWAHGDIMRTKEYFMAELRNNPGDVDVIFDYGLLLIELGNIESAKEKFHRILELREDFAPALFYLGEIAYNSGDCQRAIELYNQALQKNRNLLGPYYRLAQYALNKNRKTYVKTYLLTELQLQPDDTEVLVSMASMFLAISLESEDKRQNRQSAKGGPSADSDLDYATNCLLQAVDINRRNADAYYYLGITSALKGQLEEAEEFFSQALDINDKHIAALRDSAIVYLFMNKAAYALDRINKAKALAVDDYNIKMLHHRIWMAEKKQKIRELLSIGYW